MEQLSTVGFLTLHNIEGYNETEYFEYVKGFHDLPLEVKESMVRM